MIGRWVLESAPESDGRSTHTLQLRFAREVRVQSNNPPQMAGVTIHFYQDITGPAFGAMTAADIATDEPHAIPGGAEYYDVGGAATPIQDIAVIWELRL